MKKVTMQQIADQLGVSKFAVSQALSGKPGVSEQTRTRIIQAAAAQGYYSQRHTRSKIRSAVSAETAAESSPNTVIVLIPNVRWQSPGSSFWGRIADGVIQALSGRGIGSMVVTEHHSEQLMQIINPDKVMGLIGIGFISEPIILDIRNAGVKFVLIDHEDTLVLSDTIFLNNYDSVFKLTKHLIYLGHKQLRFVGCPDYSRSFRDRWLGFRTALEEAGLPLPEKDDILLEPNNEQEIADILRELARKHAMPTAFVCSNDFYAGCVIRSLTAIGIRVPEDVSVTGVDNTDDTAQILPPLSTIDVPKEGMGKRAVELLLKRIEDPERPIEKVLIHGEFLNRSSVAPVNPCLIK